MSDTLVKLARSSAAYAVEQKRGADAYAFTECAEALEAKDAEIAALRAAVGELGYYGHNDWCGCRDEPPKQCECHIHRNNTARANARKAAGLG